MELVLSEEQRLIRDGATQFFREHGGVARLRAHRDGRATDNLWPKLAELGWLGMGVPERWGGVGLGMAELCLVTEAAGRVLAPEPLIGALLAIDALALGGDDAQRERWLPRLISGEMRPAVAWDEQALRGDLARTMTSARPLNGHFVLEGLKRDVLGGDLAQLLVVSARHSETGQIQLFVIDPRAPGVTITPQRRIDGFSCARVTLDGVEAAEPLSDGAALDRALERATVASAAELLGTASAAFEMTLGYLRERQQFGVAIGTFQALRHRAARLYIGLELAKSAVMAAARMLDGGGDAAALGRAVSLAKARVSDSALQVADEAVQMHGGIGMTDEHDLGFYFKRARVAAMTFGDGVFHRDRWARLGGY